MDELNWNANNNDSQHNYKNIDSVRIFWSLKKKKIEWIEFEMGESVIFNQANNRSHVVAIPQKKVKSSWFLLAIATFLRFAEPSRFHCQKGACAICSTTVKHKFNLPTFVLEAGKPQSIR